MITGTVPNDRVPNDRRLFKFTVHLLLPFGRNESDRTERTQEWDTRTQYSFYNFKSIRAYARHSVLKMIKSFNKITTWL